MPRRRPNLRGLEVGAGLPKIEDGSDRKKVMPEIKNACYE